MECGLRISLKGVWFRYPGSDWVLRNVSEVFRCGETILIRGPNGSGKTTLLKIASLIYRPLAGNVYVNDEDFWSLGDDRKLLIRRRVVYIHDKPVILRGSVEYNISIGLRIRGVEESLIRDRCRAVMEELGIEGIAGRNAYSLSAGQAHMVSIARALALDPEIIFLDEPFTYLDSEKRSTLIKALQRRRALGTGLVIVSHDLEAARAVGLDRIVEMEDLHRVARASGRSP